MTDPQCPPVRTACAQTNLQLFNQLQREGYPEADLHSIRDAYELAARLYSGYFTGSGRTQLAHVVGTASIMASMRVPAELVAASLIHNVYTNGDFGFMRRGATAAAREEVCRVVGSDVERYVHRFRDLRLNPNLSPSLICQTEKLDAPSRGALLIELAEQLEHWLNQEGQGFMKRNGELMVQAAHELGFAALAARIKDALRVPTRDVNLAAPIKRAKGHQSGVLPPRSYRKRLWFWFLCGVRYAGSRRPARNLIRRACNRLLAK